MLHQLTSLARGCQVPGEPPVRSHRLPCPLAEQRRAQHVAARTAQRPGRGRRPLRVLRVPRVLRVLRERTGWTLVGFGLRLLGRPTQEDQPLVESAS
ncbi:MAG TPA: hypothetical protein VEH05_08920 [Streptosporangiaceae bacterium]|nr:hypothetical protein [Streptosporangiaceae bacterium]